MGFLAREWKKKGSRAEAGTPTCPVVPMHYKNISQHYPASNLRTL